MMRKRLLAVLAAVPVALWIGPAQAEDPPGPGPRGPGMLFQRLDKNNDGQITADEVPESVPEFVKAMLKRADRNEDKTITREEIREAAASWRPKSPNDRWRAGRGPGGPPAAGRPAQPPLQRRVPGPAAEGETPPAKPVPKRPAGPEAGPPQAGPSPARPGRAGPPQHGPPRRPEMDAMHVFRRLDRDDDGKLDPKEFAAGRKAFHARTRGFGRLAASPPAGPRFQPGVGQTGPRRSPRARRYAMQMWRHRAPFGPPPHMRRMAPRFGARHSGFHAMRHPWMGRSARFRAHMRDPAMEKRCEARAKRLEAARKAGEHKRTDKPRTPPGKKRLERKPDAKQAALKKPHHKKPPIHTPAEKP